MAKYVINGWFLFQPVTGIQRYATEIIKELDRLVLSEEIELLVPENRTPTIQFHNIRVVEYGKHSGLIWEQIDLGRYIWKNNRICINLCNVKPLFCNPGITVLHDIMCKVNPQDFKTIRSKLSRIWYLLMYNSITSTERVVITVSNFSKSEIEKVYPSSRGKIIVISPSWEHVCGFKENIEWDIKYPIIENGEFYFSLATISRNKNRKWIIEIAKKNPKSTFVIAGKYYDSDLNNLPENVIMIGYISDEDVCALIKHCKAFLFPSIYEGFGIPPLEALGLGAPVIASNTASLPEVLGNSVHYINPYEFEINIDSILSETVAPAQFALDRYSWRKSAVALFKVITE